MFTAGYAALNGLNTVLFDSLAEVGGQPEFLYPFKEIVNIPVYQQIIAADLIKRLHTSIPSTVSLELNHPVKQVTKVDSHFLIDQTCQARSVIIATGAGSFKPKQFPLPMSAEMTAKVHYYVRDIKSFANQIIGIFGGGDSALDWAKGLSQVSTVKLIHRREHFRGLESTLATLQSQENVEILTPYLPHSISWQNKQLHIGLKRLGDQTIIYRDFDQIIIAYGFRANNRLVGSWGVNSNATNVFVDRTMATNVRGIYAVGDVTTYPGRVPLIGVGFGEAQTAIHAIMRQLFPDKNPNLQSL